MVDTYSELSEQQSIAVCINTHAECPKLIRLAKDKADNLNVPWVVIYIETPEHSTTKHADQEKILRYLTMAEQMGAIICQVEDHNVIEGIYHVVSESLKTDCPITDIIIGKSRQKRFFWTSYSTQAEKIARAIRSLPITVEIIPLNRDQSFHKTLERPRILEFRLRHIAYACISVIFAFAMSELLRANIPLIEWKINRHNVIAFFLLACVIVSFRCGLIPSLITAVLSFVTMNYFYILPLRQFHLHHNGGMITLYIFVASTIVIASLGTYMRSSNVTLRRKNDRLRTMYALQRNASAMTEQSSLLALLDKELRQVLNTDIAFFLPSTMDAKSVELAYPESLQLHENDHKALKLCWQEIQVSGAGTMNRYDSNWRFEPLILASSQVGVLGIKLSSKHPIDATLGHLITALADQCSAIIGRLELEKMMSASRMNEEKEKLRSMLLSSVSHDLKTPLVSIIGSMSMIQHMRESNRIEQHIVDELVDTTLLEAERLNSFITNILDMTRIETNNIEFNQQWVAADELLIKTSKRLDSRARNHQLCLHIDDAIHHLEIFVDPLLTEQILQNLIDNAIKYTIADTLIDLSIQSDNQGVHYVIRDHGAGIPEDKLSSIFDKYERIKQTDTQTAGTGLGLAIAKAISEKQGGTIQVRNHPEGGAEFTLSFPQFRYTNNIVPLKEAA